MSTEGRPEEEEVSKAAAGGRWASTEGFQTGSPPGVAAASTDCPPEDASIDAGRVREGGSEAEAIMGEGAEGHPEEGADGGGGSFLVDATFCKNVERKGLHNSEVRWFYSNMLRIKTSLSYLLYRDLWVSLSCGRLSCLKPSFTEVKSGRWTAWPLVGSCSASSIPVLL